VIGHTLKDRYRIYDRLGSGGAATVYLARDSESGQMVVVKVMHNNLIDDHFLQRFEREIDLLRKLDNDHIIRLYDYALREHDTFLDDYLSYIVAEFVEGHTLADLVDTRGRFDEHDSLSLARQIALGLADIHSRGIVHRDIKSQNIMVTPDRTAKIIDFGIAKSSDHTTITAPSHFAGTLHYAPPEQILESRDVDHRADIYALGIVLYEMLSATLPIKDREFGTIASRIIIGDLDPLEDVSPAVQELVNDMLAVDLGERLGSAKTVVERIEELLGPETKPVIADLPDTTMMQRIFRPEEVKRASYCLVTAADQRIRLDKPSVTIGRSHPSDPNVPDIDLWRLGVENARTVSRQHCRIFVDNGTYFLEDLESMNGTRLNDAAVLPGKVYALSIGDRIDAGRVPLIFAER